MSLGKKRGSRSPDLRGAAASRKLANRGRMSPKPKQLKPPREALFQNRNATKLPRHEVYPFPNKSRKPVTKAAKIEGHKVFMTFVYGDPVVEYREMVWERLMRISLRRSGAWLMLGDFNEITSNLEKKGGRKRSDSSFLAFQNMLATCGMIEFPHTGNKLSWAGRTRSERVQCRLDRAVGNEDWHHIFSHTDVEYLLRWGSDHRPILVRIKTKETTGRRGFKFDRRWLAKEGFLETVKQGWENHETSQPVRLFDKISKCRTAISR
ncbi:uncharacterized protein LOC125575758 [Brassica napus]|uniref:uncharacterized protein LOC106373833 n=1 Tax=Brassica napus TaxID=3708 RepID=UPI0020786D9E|nr:uncharacterized protein LOC106373833 [Brassica napus]XP_048590793.1 uncharacterized protein LOC125575758 [Brassica napus]